MVFIVILSSILLAVCTSLKPIYLQNAIDAVEAGADGALTVGQTAGKVVITKAGDLNGDGRVNARDALLCLKKASGESVNVITGSADLNADGRVNARDALLCLKKASGESVVVY